MDRETTGPQAGTLLGWQVQQAQGSLAHHHHLVCLAQRLLKVLPLLSAHQHCHISLLLLRPWQRKDTSSSSSSSRSPGVPNALLSKFRPLRLPWLTSYLC